MIQIETPQTKKKYANKDLKVVRMEEEKKGQRNNTRKQINKTRLSSFLKTIFFDAFMALFLLLSEYL